MKSLPLSMTRHKYGFRVSFSSEKERIYLGTFKTIESAQDAINVELSIRGGFLKYFRKLWTKEKIQPWFNCSKCLASLGLNVEKTSQVLSAEKAKVGKAWRDFEIKPAKIKTKEQKAKLTPREKQYYHQKWTTEINKAKRFPHWGDLGLRHMENKRRADKRKKRQRGKILPVGIQSRSTGYIFAIKTKAGRYKSGIFDSIHEAEKAMNDYKVENNIQVSIRKQIVLSWVRYKKEPLISCSVCHANIGLNSEASERIFKNIVGDGYFEKRWKDNNINQNTHLADKNRAEGEYIKARLRDIKLTSKEFNWKSIWTYEKTKEKAREQYNKLSEDEKKDLHKRQNEYVKKRAKTDNGFRILRNMRSRLSTIIRRRDREASFLSYIGCSLDELLIHLESQFDENMSWGNYGVYWHIDHIKPCCMFDHTKEEQIHECWNYKNLKPLEARENLVKGAKYKGVDYKYA